jgi:hypothetical protein
MAPFQPLLSSKTQFVWTDTLDTAFRSSKEQIVQAIKNGVEIFDITRRTCLRTDWSKSGIGYYLSQQHCACTSHSPGCCENGWKITLAGSRFLNSAEQRYAPVEGEMLSVAWGLEQTRYFTQGCDNLLVVTDHKPLVKLLGDRTLDEITNTRLFRLKQRTLMWKFSIEHQPGVDNHVADATSRHPLHCATLTGITEYDNSHDPDMLMIAGVQRDLDTLMAVTWQRVQQESKRDCVMEQLVKLVENGFPTSKGDLPLALKSFWEFRDSLFLADGVIMYNDRVVIPAALRDEVLEALHSAHQGVSAMLARAMASVFWPGITTHIQMKRDQCSSCNRNAPSNARTLPMAPHIPDTPFESVFADYFDFRGWHYLVVGDRLSGWTSAYRVITGTEESGARGLGTCLRRMFATFGVPDELSSDGGPEFTATITKDFFNRWGIHHRISSAHHPQSNGRAELAVKTTKRLLEDNVGSNGNLDTDAFMRAMLVLRNTPDPDCKLSPAQIIFGRKLRDALPLFKESKQKFDDTTVRPIWRDAWAAKEDALRTRYARTYETLHEHCRNIPPLRHGDRVFVQNQVGHHPTKWDRSGTVVECREHDQYIVKIDGTGRLALRNRRFLRRFEPQSPFVNIPKAHGGYGTSDNIFTFNDAPTHTVTTPAHEPATVDYVPDDLPPQADLKESVACRHEAITVPAIEPPLSPRRSTRSRKQRKIYDATSGGYCAPTC